MNILFAEESRNDQKAFNDLIKKEGLNYRVQAVSSADEALTELESGDFDIFISDYDLMQAHSEAICKVTSHMPMIIMVSMKKTRDAKEMCTLGLCDLFLKDAKSRHIKYLPVAIENSLKHKKLERELIMARETANAANRSKTEFMANMTHELRTPLNAILGFSELMAREIAGKVNKTQKAFLNDINESGQLLLSLINDILDLSKIEAGKIELDYSLIKIRDLIERSQLFIRGKAIEKSIKMVTEIEDNVNNVFADEVRIKQVIVNLLSNSVKFTPSGGVITISAKKRDNHIEIAVKDTGKGIRKKDLSKLFQPFIQLDPDPELKKEGTGLGLALSKKIVELHGGKIRAESKWKEWCRFTFTLPAKENAE